MKLLCVGGTGWVGAIHGHTSRAATRCSQEDGRGVVCVRVCVRCEEPHEVQWRKYLIVHCEAWDSEASRATVNISLHTLATSSSSHTLLAGLSRHSFSRHS